MQNDISAYFRDRRSFVAALVIYAICSSPTPDNMGWDEMAILFLLIASLRIRFSKENMLGTWLLAYGLSIPLIISLIHGYNFSEIMRDIIPFLFLLMPVLYTFRKQQDTGLIVISVFLIGIIFSIRSLYSLGAEIFSPQTWLGAPPDLLYLANSPEVLFSCIAAFCLAFQSYDYKVWQRIMFFLLGLLPLLAMASLMQRASLFYIFVIGAIGFIYTLWKKPKYAGFLLIIFGVLFLISASFFEEILAQLYLKTHLVGVNARMEEWKAVYHEITQSWFSALFGLGWGADFENPAVGGLRVSFTHSLLSSLLLKTGLSGVIIFLIYGFYLLKNAWPQFERNKFYLYTLAGPLLIGFGLYASYKSLGYGLLILMVAIVANRKKLETLRRPVP